MPKLPIKGYDKIYILHFLNEYDDYHIPMCYNAYLST